MPTVIRKNSSVLIQKCDNFLETSDRKYLYGWADTWVWIAFVEILIQETRHNVLCEYVFDVCHSIGEGFLLVG
ncbi:hypothetical protein D3C72_1148680 [compost metagenome]